MARALLNPFPSGGVGVRVAPHPFDHVVPCSTARHRGSVLYLLYNCSRAFNTAVFINKKEMFIMRGCD